MTSVGNDLVTLSSFSYDEEIWNGTFSCEEIESSVGAREESGSLIDAVLVIGSVIFVVQASDFLCGVTYHDL